MSLDRLSSLSPEQIASVLRGRLLEVQREIKKSEKLQHPDEAGLEKILEVEATVLPLMIEDPNLNIAEAMKKTATSLGLNEAQMTTALSSLMNWQDPISLRHAVNLDYENLQKEIDILDLRDRMPIS